MEREVEEVRASKHQPCSLLLLFFPQLIPLTSLPLSKYKIESKSCWWNQLLSSEYASTLQWGTGWKGHGPSPAWVELLREQWFKNHLQLFMARVPCCYLQYFRRGETEQGSRVYIGPLKFALLRRGESRKLLPAGICSFHSHRTALWFFSLGLWVEPDADQVEGLISCIYRLILSANAPSESFSGIAMLARNKKDKTKPNTPTLLFQQNFQF